LASAPLGAASATLQAMPVALAWLLLPGHRRSVISPKTSRPRRSNFHRKPIAELDQIALAAKAARADSVAPERDSSQRSGGR